MTPTEQARRVAEWCGWRQTQSQLGNFTYPWQDRDGEFHREHPLYESTDACREFEAEIKRRGLFDDYVHHLYGEVVGFDNPALPSGLWMFNQITATAAQRLAACCAVIEQMEGK